jgi:hypothetical protein
MFQEELDVKSKKVLTDLLNEQIDSNEVLVNENDIIKDHLRKLLNLLR